MFEDIAHREYRGYNPAFVKRVRAKRRQERKLAEAEAMVARRVKKGGRAIRDANLRRAKHEREVNKARASASLTAYVAERENLLKRLAAIEPKTAKDLAIRYAASHGFFWEEVISKSRTRGLAAVRHGAILAVKEAFPTYSTPMIGKIFQRDHTTIVHALKKGSRP